MDANEERGNAEIGASLVEVATEADIESAAVEAPCGSAGEDSPDEVASRIAIAKRTSGFRRTLADVAALVAEKDDPSVLFRNNWLARGQSFLLTSSSGVGKSSMFVQMAYNWTAGREFMANPMRPLKIALIQAEDSERDLAEQREGMRKGLAADGWTDDAILMAEKSILLPSCFVGLTGDKFIKALREFQGDSRCDLLMVNPIQAFFGGDVSAQADVSKFCREGIDPILKSPDIGCAAGFVQHTAKITGGKGNSGNRPSTKDYGEYMGAGSHEWTDWARAIFSFLKHTTDSDAFDFTASKRGQKLRWTSPMGTPTMTKLLRHHPDFIYWVEVRDSGEYEELQTATDRRRDEDVQSAMIQVANELKSRNAAAPMGMHVFYKFFNSVRAGRAVMRKVPGALKARAAEEDKSRMFKNGEILALGVYVRTIRIPGVGNRDYVGTEAGLNLAEAEALRPQQPKLIKEEIDVTEPWKYLK